MLASASNGGEKVVELHLCGHLESRAADNRVHDLLMNCFGPGDSTGVDSFDEGLGLLIDTLRGRVDLVMVMLGVCLVEKHSAVSGVVLKADLTCALRASFLDQVTSIVTFVAFK